MITFAPQCATSLINALRADDHDTFQVWTLRHVETPADFLRLTNLLASLAASFLIDQIAAPAGAIYGPMTPPDATSITRDAGLLVTMCMNQDQAGVHGVLMAIIDRDELEEVTGELAIITRAAVCGRVSASEITTSSRHPSTGGDAA